MTDPIDLNEIRFFTAIVKNGSFTAAAHHLALPKATLSRRISHLEQSLGSRLLNRTTRKLSLTEAGRIYFDHCTRILEAVEVAAQAVTSLQTNPSGTLRITASGVFGVTVLSVWVSEFLQRYPEVRVEVLMTNRTVDLIEEQIDVAFRAGSVADASLTKQPLGSVVYWVCASPTYVRQHGTPTQPQELSQHRCIESVRGTFSQPSQWILQKGSSSLTVEVTPALRVNDFLFIKAAVLADLGIALMPHFLIKTEIASGQLIRLLPDWSTQERDLFLVYPSTGYLPPKLRAFIDFVVSQSTQDPLTLSGENPPAGSTPDSIQSTRIREDTP